MSEAILNFSKQLNFQPVIENAGRPKKYDSYFLLGMGGSHLSADLALWWNPELPLRVHSDYGLPPGVAAAKRPLIIACSYSGNTEEVIDGLKLAIKRKLPVAVIAVGGTLLVYAQKHRLPYIQIPNTGIQPRSALGLMFRALLAFLGEEKGLRDCAKLAKKIQPAEYLEKGKALAAKLQGFVPVIYASRRNFTIAWNWKIKLNETGKIPAFYNLLPEMNHNEMTGFATAPTTRALSERFYFILLKDKADHPRVQKRMEILEKLYRERQLPVQVETLAGQSPLEKAFSSLLLADWVSVYTAENYGLDSEAVPMVEEFKKMMEK